MKRYILFTVLFGLAVYTTNAQTPTVIELFTSQGCSSCPPADKLLAEVQEQHGKEIITLSYHVDYWDYIGWKDPFASEVFTQKQYAYANRFKSRNVYTPQAVINGSYHFTGSDRGKMSRAIASAIEKREPAEIRLPKVVRDANKVFVNYSVSNINEAQSITFALTLKNRVTAIKRGENRNRTLENHNIVVDLTEFAVEETGNAVLHIPEWITVNDNLSVVAYISQKGEGIVGALSRKL